jgi:hypothetical protein
MDFDGSVPMEDVMNDEELTLEQREEMARIADVIVAGARVGKEDVAYAAPLTRFAVAQYRSGRLVNTRLNVRDVTSFYCQRRKNIAVERLDRWDDEDECWREILVEDRNCTPAELAASRIDSRPGWRAFRRGAAGPPSCWPRVSGRWMRPADYGCSRPASANSAGS